MIACHAVECYVLVMKQILLALLIAVLIVPTACAEDPRQELPKAPYTEPLIIQTQGGDTYTFYVDVADTPPKIIRGLMNRESMPEMAGMLFSFALEKQRNFWMRNTLIPLDMLFIKADGTIHHIHENAIPHDETSISSQGPVLNVVEINGGMSRKLGIEKGDVVHHPVFGNAL